ncbi:MAG: hypothetical protein SVM86_02790, partial [Candidatus Cloacimonadota bacterium]|nr:hypothetical protein [Candidatus Cloacimonadota bacterium]
MKKLLLLVLLFIAGVVLLANSDLVMEINIEGNDNIETQLIRSLLTFEVGSSLRADDISSSIKN